MRDSYRLVPMRPSYSTESETTVAVQPPITFLMTAHKTEGNHLRGLHSDDAISAPEIVLDAVLHATFAVLRLGNVVQDLGTKLETAEDRQHLVSLALSLSSSLVHDLEGIGRSPCDGTNSIVSTSAREPLQRLSRPNLVLVKYNNWAVAVYPPLRR